MPAKSRALVQADTRSLIKSHTHNVNCVVSSGRSDPKSHYSRTEPRSVSAAEVLSMPVVELGLGLAMVRAESACALLLWGCCGCVEAARRAGKEQWLVCECLDGCER